MLTFVDPRGLVKRAIEPYRNSLDVHKNVGADITVGLLANGFPDSELFLRKLGSVIQKRLPQIETKIWNKGNPGITVPEQILRTIVDHCNVVVTAYGH